VSSASPSVIPAGHPQPAMDHVTPYDRLAWSDTEVEEFLVSGAHRDELEAYFGVREYAALRRLAQRARSTPETGGRTIIVPGIMGSQLGLRRRTPLPQDILWLDPVDISLGRLSALALPGNDTVLSFGVVLYSYLRLKLHLRIAGFAPVFHHYDWRLGVDQLGRELSERIARESEARVRIVAHSMGGLVSRAALALPAGSRVERLVLLGTPNLGSFAAVQALRGTYAVVRKLARLDSGHTPESLAAGVFSTFPSLYDMLPPKGANGVLDLFDLDAWPDAGPRPSAALLDAARNAAVRLARADDRFATVVGVGQETVTAVSRQRGDFIYTVTRRGDGTVPTSHAELAGSQTYYAEVSHSELARDGKVAQAVADLLRGGRTRRLPQRWNYGGTAAARISDSALRRTHTGKVDWAALEADERRVFLQNLNEPPKLRLRARRVARRAK
jgi:hypothetical protein